MSSTHTPELPFVDTHAIGVHADAERAWDAVAQVMRGSSERSLPPALRRLPVAFARLMRCADVDAPPPGEGLPRSMVGFHVARAERPSLIALEGSHRFSRYALTFRVESAPGGGCVVEAETRAAFPGVAGRAYRQLVIGTRGHVLAVRRMLSVAKRLAERGA